MIFIDMKNPSNKTEKELLDEAMEKWPEELEREIEAIQHRYSLITEGSVPNFKSIEEIRAFYGSIPWEEYKKKWIR